MQLTPEERTVGKANFHEAVGTDLTRRGFLQASVVSAVTPPIIMGATYFGYDKLLPNPVRIGVIGTGDEGNVLIGAMNPQFVDVRAISEIRPYNVHRAFHGDWSSNNALRVRPGLITQFGYADESQAHNQIAIYEDYKKLLEQDDIEAVVIALPLHLHAEVAIAAMNSGKHVLTEKLMAYNVGQCKDMARVARRTGQILATGHQRHYSVLYDNAKNLIQWGLLGEVHHIRAQWHRGNLPHNDSWKQPLPGGEIAWDPKSKTKRNIDEIQERLKTVRQRTRRRGKERGRYAAASPAPANLTMDGLGFRQRRLESHRPGRRSTQTGGLRLPDDYSVQWTNAHGTRRTVPLAVVATNWRRFDGRTWKPSAGRGQYLYQCFERGTAPKSTR